MNDLRRILIWLIAVAALAVGIWGFQRDEVTAARPFAPENRAFRLAHRVSLCGHEFALPLKEMACGWGGIGLVGLAMWPLATPARSRRVFGRWEKSHPR